MYGKRQLDIDIQQWKDKFYNSYIQNDFKKSGVNKGNRHYKFTQDDRELFTKIINPLCNIKLNWFFEFFYATEPVGLHNDYLQQYWDEESDTRDVAGVLVPLDWDSKLPYTIFFDKFTEDTKLIFRKGEMRNYKTDEIYHYRDTEEVDAEIDFYHPPKTTLRKQFANLKIESVYPYEKNTGYIFDTRQWHSGSWFLNSTTVEPDRTEYKLIISGFGALNIYK